MNIFEYLYGLVVLIGGYCFVKKRVDNAYYYLLGIHIDQKRAYERDLAWVESLEKMAENNTKAVQNDENTFQLKVKVKGE